MSCERSGVRSARYVGDLGRCKGDYAILGIVPEIDIEVMEIAASSSHYDRVPNHG